MSRTRDRETAAQNPGGEGPSEASDPLLRAAGAVADGEDVDWEKLPEDTDAVAVKNLRQLAAISGVMRAVGSPRPNPQQADPELERWGHLRLLEELGRGSFGRVFRAFDPTLQRDVAVKLRQASNQNATNEGWIEEARRLARVRHPNVLAVHGADIHDDVAGLWCDLMSGRTLEEMIRAEGALGPRRGIAIGIQLADALASVHQAGIVHGDLKPSNVMLEEGDHAVLMDFGAGSTIAGDPHAGGQRFGSPLVMAPEQFRGHGATVATDVYALGVLLYRMLTGHYPVQATSIDELAEVHARGRPEQMLRRLRGVPRALTRLILDLTDHNSPARPDAARVAERLREIQRQPARRRRRIAMIGLILALAAGLAVTVEAYRRTSAAEAETEAVNDFLLELLASPRLIEEGDQVRVVDVLRQAGNRARSQFAHRPELRARTLFIIGRTYFSLSDYQTALSFFNDAHAAQAGSVPESDPRHLRLLYYLSRSLDETGNPEQAMELAERLLGLSDAHLPEDDALAVLARRRMASAHGFRQDLTRAEEYVREAVALREGSAWDDDRDGNLARLDLAQILIEQGRFAEAEPIIRRCLQFSLRHDGERNRNTLAARHSLIISLNQQGQYEEAHELALRNFELASSWLGSESHGLAVAASDLSATSYHLGDYESAVRYDDIAIEIVTARKGADHPDTLVAMVNRGTHLKELGDYLSAETAYRQVIEVGREKLGDSNALVLMTQFNLAELLYETQRFEASHKVALTAEALLLDSLGERHIFTLATQAIKGASLTAMGEPKRAEAILRKALDRFREVMGEDNPYTLDTAIYLVRALLANGRRDQALALLEDSHQRLMRALGPNHQKTLDARSLLESMRAEHSPASLSTNQSEDHLP